jgi:polyprenyl P-hydroxybenzoate/phenylacrylic acid decarboxylase-like protein
MVGAREDAGRPVVVAMAGDDGLGYGRELLEALRRLHVETHLVLTVTAENALGDELASVRALADHVYTHDNQAARIASGSFRARGMVVAPCDARSVAAIVMGLATNLVYRAADVTLKEHRPLVLAVLPVELAAVDLELRERARRVPGLSVVELEGPIENAVERLLAGVSVVGDRS